MRRLALALLVLLAAPAGAQWWSAPFNFPPGGGGTSISLPVSVANGGTGVATCTAYDIVFAGTTATGAMQCALGLGSSGLPLVSGGAGSLPSWTALGVAGGGTGDTTCTAYSPVVSGTTSTGAFRCSDGPGTSTYVWTSNGAGVTPSWQAAPAFAAAGSGSELQSRATATTVAAVTGSSSANGGIALVNQSAAAIPLSVTGASAQSGDYFDIGRNGGSAGDIFKIVPVASNVNGLSVTASATGNPVIVAPTGTDSNVSLKLSPKGTGQVLVTTSAGTAGLLYASGDGLLVTNGSTGSDFAVANGFGGIASTVQGGAFDVKVFSSAGIGTILIDSTGNIGITGSGDTNGSVDTNISRIAAGVWGDGTGAQANHAGFRQNGGTCIVASDQTNSTTTMASSACYNVTSGTVGIALAAGRTYTGVCELFLSDSVAADGAKIDFNGGTATVTTFIAQITAFDTALNLSTQTSALATAASASTFTGAGAFEVHLGIKVNAAGTFQPEFAQVAHTAGVLTEKALSHCTLVDSTP